MFVTEAELPEVRWAHRHDRIVLAGGTYDILHPGHTGHLAAAKALGGLLVVMIASDSEVKARKSPSRPINPAQQRAEVVDALGVVDYTLVRSGAEHVEAVGRVVDALQPDVFFLARTVGTGMVQAMAARIGPDTQMIFDEEQRSGSTSAIIARIRGEQGQ